MFDTLFTTYSEIEPPPIINDRIKQVQLDYHNYIESGLIDNNMQFDLDYQNDPLGYKFEPPAIKKEENNIKDYSPFEFLFQNNTQINKQFTQNNRSNIKSIKGKDTFEKAFEQAVNKNPELKKHKAFFTKLCQHEGGFNPSIQNSAGAPYYGYFGFGHAALKQVSNYTMDQFRKDPVEQILAAGKLYNWFIKEAKRLGYYNKAKQMGYSDDAIVAGCWLGGAGGVKNYILNNKDASDSHWYGGKGGTSISKRMKLFN